MIVFDTRKSIRQAALWLAVCVSLVMTWSSAAAQQGKASDWSSRACRR